jgi:uncharacterized repeat protein (TIGR01451 family)
MFRRRRATFGGLLSVLALTVAVAPGSVAAQTARIGIDTGDSPDPVMVRDVLTYTLTVTNTGPDPATAVHVADTIPARVNFGSAASSQGGCGHPARRRVSCNLGTLDPGVVATISIRLVPTHSGRISNRATVSAREDDPNPGDDKSVETTTVIEPVIVDCAGRRATIVGTEGDDQLTGTAGPDVIAALGGNDAISALGSNDLICGFGGSDAIRAGGGNDAVKAGGGDDGVRAGGGDDAVQGGTGDDGIRGGSGVDNLRGKGGLDHLRGGSGGDVLRGGGGNDVCRGGPGADVKRSC